MDKYPNNELYSQLDCYLISKNFNGSVLIGSKGQILINKGFGMANFEHDVQNTTKTKYRVASISKQFTATAILLLEEKELINLFEPISKFIPNFPNGDIITIHHLLTHSSGIPNFNQFPDFGQTKGSFSTLLQTIERFKYKPLEFSPGTQFSYCNSGYILLAHLIEIISETSFEEFLNEHIFLPLNMHDTGHDNHKNILKNRAAGYELQERLMNVDFIDMSIPKGSGSLYSTVEDLYLWDRSLYTEKILKTNSLQKMFSLNIGDYGYGWFLDRVDINNQSRKRIHHSGGIFGFQNQIHRYVDNDIVIIMSSNIGTSELYPLCMELASIVFNEN